MLVSEQREREKKQKPGEQIKKKQKKRGGSDKSHVETNSIKTVDRDGGTGGGNGKRKTLREMGQSGER